MKPRFPVLLLIAAMLGGQPSRAQRVEEVTTAAPDAPALPEDLFRLTPGTWAFGKQLWKGEDPCTTDECEGGYTSGDLVVSVERSKTYVRIVAGFRNCASVAWNEYKIGKSASSGDTKAIARLIRKTVGISAKYCKIEAPTVAQMDARQLFLIPPQPAR